MGTAILDFLARVRRACGLLTGRGGCAGALVALTWLLLPGQAGCDPGRPIRAEERRYFGPTEPMEQVVWQINANNELLPTLWAEHYFEAWIYDAERDRTVFANGEGLMLFRQPLDFRFTGLRPGARIFDMGSNGVEYWLTVPFQMDTMWWGRFEHIGKPCAGEMPIRPDLLLEVLGVRLIETDFLRPPVPTMRFNPDADAYMFLWNMPGRDRWFAQREIWYDRRTKLPTLVVLFDENGRVLLRAYLLRHEQVEVPGVEPEQWPRVATDYRLFFPDTRSRMEIQLERVQLSERGAPRDISFRLPAPQAAGVSQVIQIDAECDR